MLLLSQYTSFSQTTIPRSKVFSVFGSQACIVNRALRSIGPSQMGPHKKFGMHSSAQIVFYENCTSACFICKKISCRQCQKYSQIHLPSPRSSFNKVSAWEGCMLPLLARIMWPMNHWNFPICPFSLMSSTLSGFSLISCSTMALKCSGST